MTNSTELKVLALDTSSQSGSVALCHGTTVIAESFLNVHRTHSENLFRQIDLALRDADWSLRDIDLLAAVTGPGSFTGLRIGVAMIKGLGQVLGKPVVSVSSLQATAMNLPLAGVPVCVLLDARKKEVYTQTFRWKDGVPVADDEAQVLPPQRLLANIASQTVFVGSGVLVYQDLISSVLDDRAVLAPPTAHQLRSSAVAYLAVQQWLNGNTEKPADMLPLYVRPSDAELNLTVKQSG